MNYNMPMKQGLQDKVSTQPISSANQSDDSINANNTVCTDSSVLLQPNIADKVARTGNRIRITKKIAITGVLTAISYGLYLLGMVCKLPFIFPSFFDLQFSELPAIIGGFALGPVYGAAIIVIKCALKLPLSSTAFVGELCDCILGLSFVVPAAIIYSYFKSKKGAIIAICVGAVICVGVSVLLNRFVNVPFYVMLFFKGDWQKLIGMLSVLFPKINKDNFYAYYLCLSVIPFNLLRCLVTSVITFAVYKKVSFLFKKITG